MTTWTNWAGTVSANVTVAAPATVAELAKLVAECSERGQHVKPIGAGHSFTPIGATDGVQLRLDRLAGIVKADRETGQVTVQAGTRLHALNDTLCRPTWR
jgi:L-gulonolactone oxidase